MTQLRLAIVTTDYHPDAVASGIGSYSQALANGLAARGHIVHVVSRAIARTPGVEQGSGPDGRVMVHRLGPPRVPLPYRMSPTSILAMLARGLASEIVFRRRVAEYVATLIRREAIQLVETADSPAEMVLFDPTRHRRVPFVVRLHGPTSVWELLDRNVPEYVRRGMALLERRQCLRATHLSCPSEAGAAWIGQELGLRDRPIATYPNPPNTPAARSQCPPPQEDDGLVLYVGRITRGKGVDVLVRAFIRVAHSCPTARLVFVGPDYPTPEPFASTVAYLRHLLPAGLADRVTFEGYCARERLGEYYRRAAVCVVPSLFEVFGYACIEAMSHGKAIVASDRGGMVDLLDRGRCGLLFTPPDDAALAERILELLRDPRLRQRLGECARERVSVTYSLDSVIDQAEAFYRTAITERLDA